ncbi:hypothetical protein CEK25_002887 [Fusarium fujikuroi]|nr:hypothetical protein CEK25_002887 [Fusarium fujikuroi]
MTTQVAYQRIATQIRLTTKRAASDGTISLNTRSIYYGTGNVLRKLLLMNKGAVLFMGILMNAQRPISEINNLYASQRPIVEANTPPTPSIPRKAISGIVADIIKFISAGVQHYSGNFFLVFLVASLVTFFLSSIITYISTFVMTVLPSRTMAAKTVFALVMLAGIMVLVIYMIHGCEFHGREFDCSQFIPSYSGLSGSFICSVVGSVADSEHVSGDANYRDSYSYVWRHVWRNFGILMAFMLIGFMLIYFIAKTELNSKVLDCEQGQVPARLQEGVVRSPAHLQEGVTEETNEGQLAVPGLEGQTDCWTWKTDIYHLEIKDESR